MSVEKNYDLFLKSYINGQAAQFEGGDKGNVIKVTKGVYDSLQLYRAQGSSAGNAGKKNIFKFINEIANRNYFEKKGGAVIEKTTKIRPALLRLVKQYFVPSFTAPRSYCNLGVEMIKGKEESAARPRVVLFSQKLNGMNLGNRCRVTLKEDLKELTLDTLNENEDWYKLINNAAMCLDSVEAKRLLLWDIKLPLTFYPPKLEIELIGNKFEFFSFVMSRFSIAWLDVQKREELHERLTKKTDLVNEVSFSIDSLFENVDNLIVRSEQLKKDLTQLASELSESSRNKLYTPISIFLIDKKEADAKTKGDYIKKIKTKLEKKELDTIGQSLIGLSYKLNDALTKSIKLYDVYFYSTNNGKVYKRPTFSATTPILWKIIPRIEQAQNLIANLKFLVKRADNLIDLFNKNKFSETQKLFQIYNTAESNWLTYLTQQRVNTETVLEKIQTIQEQRMKLNMNSIPKLTDENKTFLLDNKNNLHLKILQRYKTKVNALYTPINMELKSLESKKLEQVQTLEKYLDQQKKQPTEKNFENATKLLKRHYNDVTQLSKDISTEMPYMENALKKYDLLWTLIYNEEVRTSTFKKLTDEEKTQVRDLQRVNLP